MTTAPVVDDRLDPFSCERAELAAVQASVLFQRAPKLARILAYICQKHFENKSAGLNEYSIAVEALDRPTDFDPQTDAIVRVDIHLLRKRLHLYYEQEGKDHALQIVLPSGHYAPEFVRNGHARPTSDSDEERTGEVPAMGNFIQHERRQMDASEDPPPFSEASAFSYDGEAAPATPLKTRKEWAEIPRQPADAVTARPSKQRQNWLLVSVSCLVGVLLGAGTALLVAHRNHSSIQVLEGSPNLSDVVTASIMRYFSPEFVSDSYDKGIRILFGTNEDYTDSAGFKWRSDRYFNGGIAFDRPANSIFRSMDPALYTHGRHGVFHYDIPVPPGIYELHLLFAETEPGVQDGMREVSYTIGAGQTDTVDVASDAGGANTATMKVYTDIRPGNDGKIHLSFWSTDGFINALEILPEVHGKPNPLRISALPHLYTDRAGHNWLPDRFFLGGRNTTHMFSPNGGDQPLFSHERFGNFNYSLPVARNYSYQLTLYMAERYWGPPNSGLGGVGSRIFDVRCNEQELLHNFDLLKTQGFANAIAIRFHHLSPDSSGKLNISFVPVTNYPMVNALEVDPEQAQDK